MRLGKFCLIVNPIAGHGRSAKILPEVESALRERGLSFDVACTSGPGDAVEIAKRAAESGYSAVVAMGGDGTLEEVVNGVLSSGNPGIAVGTIPSGTGNDFASGNNLFSHWSHALDALQAPRRVKMDVFRVTDSAGFSRWAINSVGFGFDAYVVQRVQKYGSKKFGRLSYFIEALRGAFDFAPTTLEVYIDGVKNVLPQAWLLAITNTPRYGGGLKVCPDAVSGDGQLDALLVNGISRSYVLCVLPLVFQGRHVGKKGVRLERAREIEIHAAPGFPSHMDGDLVDFRYPVKVALEPARVEFLIKS
ncbi:MAG: diacylglycerol kinase family lipid kinase [Firmicutes bacterium]|nr:diacylglycerol kinase family lipid kinase [Candidatus Fermentithermobacillaceae bacterium]